MLLHIIKCDCTIINQCIKSVIIFYIFACLYVANFNFFLSETVFGKFVRQMIPRYLVELVYRNVVCS
jgi:hypothetical protein